MDIEVTSGTEHTEWVKRVEFPKRIAYFASDKNEVTKEVKRHTDSPDDQSF